MRIRAIESDDLPAVTALLAEGFPARPATAWRAGLARLATRPQIQGFPRFGLVMEDEAGPQGVILLITAAAPGGTRSNLSSWYVRPAHRQAAVFMLQKLLRLKGTTFLNLTPAAHVLPIMQALGFRPYTDGTQLLSLADAWRPSAPVRALDAASAARLLPPDQAALAARHLRDGCGALLLEDAAGPALALYRVKRVKRVVPAARFLAGPPALLARQAGGLMRHLLGRGVALAMLDRPMGLALPHGTALPGRDIRYFRGPEPPEAGDLADTELAILGL